MTISLIFSSSPARWSLPFGVFLAMLATFEIADKILSKTIKSSLASFLIAKKHISILERLPDLSEEAFESIFGERHISLRCIKSSFLISIFAIFLTFLFTFMYNPNALIQFVGSLSLGFQEWVHALQVN